MFTLVAIMVGLFVKAPKKGRNLSCMFVANSSDTEGRSVRFGVILLSFKSFRCVSTRRRQLDVWMRILGRSPEFLGTKQFPFHLTQ